MSWRVVAAVAISTVLGTVACAAALVAGATTPPAVRSAAHADVPPSEPGPLEPQPSLVLGTLGTEPAHAQAEHAAGVRMAQLELGWDAYEPRDGVFDERYADRQRARLRTLREAGMQVVLGIGLQYPPDWVLAAADAQYVNQYGEAAAVPNLTFNQALRDKAEQYIARVDRDLGLRNFAAIRVGSGGLIEALYPTGHFSERPNSFWAYDANAQAGSRRPPTIPAPPYVGWRPGERAYQGRPFTAAQVEEWYAWYLAALADGVRWQIGTYRGLGFDGRYFVLMPGVGVRPAAYQSAIDRYLASDDPDGILGRGAVWHKLVEALRDQPGVVVYVSSVADGSGADDLCRPEDAGVDPQSDVVASWSATRWLSYAAKRAGLPLAGENPGQHHTSRYGLDMLAAAARQARTCGFQALFWAHDQDLYDPESGVGLHDLADVAAGREPYGTFDRRAGE